MRLLKTIQRSVALLVGLVFLAYSTAMASQSAVSQTRDTLKQWVEAEQVLSQEAVQWRQERSLLKDLVSVLDKEIAILKETIAENASGLTSADEQRAALVEKREHMRKQREWIARFLSRAEAQAFALRRNLPEPLLEKLAPLYNRMPEHAEPTALGIAERMQAVLGIFDAVRTFDQKFSVHQEIREQADGSLQEVTTLYVGLAQAFYVSGDDAGVGYPSSTGWIWESNKDLSDRIHKAIAMLKGTSYEIDYLPLPLSIQNAEDSR